MFSRELELHISLKRHSHSLNLVITISNNPDLYRLICLEQYLITAVKYAGYSYHNLLQILPPCTTEILRTRKGTKFS